MVITCPEDLTIQCDESTDPSNTGTATAEIVPDDNGYVINITFSDVDISGVCEDERRIEREWIATTGTGDSDSCQQIIDVDDTTPPDLTIPPDALIECGASTDPTNTGFATAIDACDTDPALTVSDVSENSCTGIYRTWTATDACGNESSQVQLITFPFPPVSLDIKPGSCPNPVNVISKGVVPVAILGTADFDVTEVDIASIHLFAMADLGWIGIRPIRVVVADVGTPFPGDPQFDCHEETADGFFDLDMKFGTEALAELLGLFEDGDNAVLCVSGNLLDGVPIEGCDNVVIKRKGR